MLAASTQACVKQDGGAGAADGRFDKACCKSITCFCGTYNDGYCLHMHQCSIRFEWRYLAVLLLHPTSQYSMLCSVLKPYVKRANLSEKKSFQDQTVSAHAE
jgi:hypothetical protein